MQRREERGDQEPVTTSWRLHARSDQYEQELRASQVDREDSWTVFWADDGVFLRVRDEHVVSLEHLA